MNDLDDNREWVTELKKADLDKDGKVDFHEFVTASISKRKLLVDKNIKAVFDTFDIDHNGKISLNEFRR